MDVRLLAFAVQIFALLRHGILQRLYRTGIRFPGNGFVQRAETVIQVRNAAGVT
ncbi:hypothetical protein ACY1LM_01375 [Klebsiella pneumoniae]